MSRLAQIFQMSGRLRMGFLLGLLLFVGLLGGISHRVLAATPADLYPVPADRAPADIIQTIQDRCASGWHVVQFEWISEQDVPASKEVYVDIGTTDIPLQFNWISYRCRHDNPDIIAGHYHIDSTSPLIPELVGVNGDVNYVPGLGVNPTPAHDRPAATDGKFNLNVIPVLGGPVTGRTTINIDVVTAGTVERNATPRYNCAIVNEGDYGGPTTGPYDVSACVREHDITTITVNVNAGPVLDCNLTMSTTTPSVGQPMSATAVFSWSGGFRPNPANYQMTMTGPGFTDTPVAWTQSGKSVSGTLPFTAPATPGIYTVSARFFGPAGIDKSCQTDITIAQRPYFSVRGGDTMAGASFTSTTGGVCPAGNPTAGIISWNTDTAPAYAGAGDTYAAFARSQIQDFATSTSRPANQPRGLAFSNQGSAASGTGLFGGMFGNGACLDMWTSKQLSSIPSWTGFGAGSGDYYVDATSTPLVLAAGGATVPAGTHLNLYVTGKVSIAGNIQYANSGGYGALTAIPSFKLVVNGSIFISSNVQSLDGTYAALPDTAALSTPNSFSSPNAGTISTCAHTGTVQTYDPSSSSSNVINACRTQLNINGSLAAQQIWFLRTDGDLGVEPAEQINNTPDLWLSTGDSTGKEGDKYDTIRAMPPVL